MVNKNCAILINTCDSYSDVWAPFLSLFRFMWPDCRFPIYLNTESKTLDQEVFNINYLHYDTNMGARGHRNWSNRLKMCLERISEDYVLMVLEDFFLMSQVRQDKIMECLDWMGSDANVVAVSLKSGADYEDEIVNNEFSKVVKGYEYVVSTQAAIWRKDFLIQILRDGESAWEFEFYGSGRYNRIYEKRGYKIYTHRKGFLPVMDYEFEEKYGYGIVQGKWLRKNVELFDMHNIGVDFDARGFFGETVINNDVSLEKSGNRTKLSRCINVIKNPGRAFKTIRYSKLGNMFYKRFYILFKRRFLNR